VSNALKSIHRSNTKKAMQESEFIQQLGVEASPKMDRRAMEFLLRPDSLKSLQLLSKMDPRQIKQLVQTCGPTARMKLMVALVDLEKTAEKQREQATPKVRQLLMNEDGSQMTPEQVQEAAVAQGQRIAAEIPGAVVLPDGRVIVPPKKPAEEKTSSLVIPS